MYLKKLVDFIQQKQKSSTRILDDYKHELIFDLVDSEFEKGKQSAYEEILYKINEINEPVDIEFKNWDYTCGDGCCTDWGTELYVGEKEITRNYSDNPEYVGEILHELGIQFHIKNYYVWGENETVEHITNADLKKPFS